MSIPNLPVDFKDDILSSSNTKRKYQQTYNNDGSVSLEDVTQYTQKGSEFGASQVNQTNGAVNNIYDERILTLEEAALVTEPGFFVDAQVITELNGNLNGIGQVAEVGNYGEWNLPTSDYYQIGNKMQVVNNAYYQTSTENSIITIKQAGVYLVTFNARCIISSERGTIWTRITKNNADIAGLQNNGNIGYIGVAYSKVVKIDAGDKINAYMSATGTIKSAGYDSLSIMRVSA